MSARRGWAPIFTALAVLALLVSGCGDTRVVGSEIGNPTIAGVILNPDGSPAAGAMVSLRRKDYVAMGIGETLIRSEVEPEIWLAKKGVFKADVETDAKGRFKIDSVDTGSYRIEVIDALGKGVLLDVAVTLDSGKIELPAGTARANGSISGTLRTLDPAAAQYIAWVRGVERAALVSSVDGRFTLPNCPAGVYTLYFGCLDRGCLSKEVPNVTVEVGTAVEMDTVFLQTFSTEIYAAWKSSMKISLNTTATGADVADSVAGFPLLVRLDSSNFPFAGADGNGRDIRFLDGQGNRLPFEIERWDSLGRKAEIWVRLETVHGNSASQLITMYWGNPAAEAFASGAADVFPRTEGYRGVWHLSENPASADNGYRDASANANHGVGYNLPAARSGLTGPGLTFNGASSVKVAADSSLHTDAGVSIELWANFAGLGSFRRLVSKAFSSGKYPWTEYDIESDSTGRRIAFVVGLRDSMYGVKSVREIRTGEWIHVTGSFDGTELRVYINGVLEGAVERKGAIADHGRGLVFGKYEHDEASNFNGSLDEIRITGKPRSAAWIRLSYENQKPGSGMLTFSAPSN